MDKTEIVKNLQEALEANRLIKKEYYKNHFYEFCRDVLCWPDLYEPLHRELCDFVQHNQEKYRLIMLAREHLKSTVVTVSYSVWKIVNDPNITILISNATEPKAKDFLRQIKDFLRNNKKIREIYGDLSADAPEWSENSIRLNRDDVNKKEATVTAYGIGGSLTSAHYDLLIFDDLMNRDTSGSKEQIDKVIQFWKDGQALRAGGHSEYICIGTPWNDYDLYSWIRDKNNKVIQDFVVMERPAYDGEFRKSKIAYPTRFTWDSLDRLRRQMGTDFYAQYLLDPTPSETAVFKKEYFKTFQKEDFKDRELFYFVTIDPSLPGEVVTARTDYWGIIVNAVTEDNDWLIWEIIRERFDPKQGIDQIFELDRKYKPNKIAIETTSFQRVLKYFTQEEMKKRNHYLPLVELKHVGRNMSKSDRISGLQPRYADGSIYHSAEDPLTEMLEYELLHFPSSKHDDICLVGDTLIKTGRGDIPIKDIKVGDVVLTRAGYKKVLSSRMTGTKEVITSLGITATPDHPFITTKGVKPLTKLIASDIIHVWNQSKQKIEKLSYMEVKSIIDTQTHPGFNFEPIFGDTISGKLHRFLSTVKYGLTTVVKFLKEWLYIMKMEILSTMKSRTWSYFHDLPMQPYILINHSGRKSEDELLRLPKRQQKHGTEAQKEERGTGNTGKIRLEKVYNLKVKGRNEFFANNILVHNSDALASQNEIAFAPRSSEKKATRQGFGKTFFYRGSQD